MRAYHHWIGGKDAVGHGPDRVTRSSPAHGALLASYAAGTAEDVDRAAQTAAAAQVGWAAMTGMERAGRITALADLILRDRERLAVIEAEEAGKTIRDARGELSHSANLARYAAALAWEIPGRAQSHHGDSALGLVTYEPRGVVGMITPWNFPAVTLFQKLPYALAAGNAVVIKPSELTSGTTLEIARLAAEAGIPDGVINVVTGKGTVVGTAMIEHPLVDMISFTGSTRAGTEIGAACARQVKRAGLELGGKAANVVFADADLDDALDGALFGTILNAGQECVAGTRILVERRIAKDFTEALVERAAKLRVGMPLDETADIASVIHEAHMTSVLGHIETARKEGARIAAGGHRKLDGDFGKGYFVQPSILADVTPSMTYFREEVFGPVASITVFDTIEEAVALANDTTYGLGNGLWTKDVDKALQLSKRLKSGTVWVNTYLDGAPQMPFGGYKRSGLGRENGIEGLIEFMDVKSTFIRLGKRTKALGHTAA
ncbi:aldehyde dehydrogenase family protein [Tabrizicola oligotrophica]|uniref:Aldehyde dehydrogenase family protein n=1 Tax=Tabrizicola oligotrophica TaxID=2710650 RepID=A0A6M0QUN4_9RHOB|nr:aldehyde dehydrogenase family protein [Tabrizicola oligotrophica]NEY90353.1 aldehyde dehydrogenase family protein [Tabrizicola oligotrophica]